MRLCCWDAAPRNVTAMVTWSPDEHYKEKQACLSRGKAARSFSTMAIMMSGECLSRQACLTRRAFLFPLHSFPHMLKVVWSYLYREYRLSTEGEKGRKARARAFTASSAPRQTSFFMSIGNPEKIKPGNDALCPCPRRVSSYALLL